MAAASTLNDLTQSDRSPSILAEQIACVPPQSGFAKLPVEIETKIFAMSIDRSLERLLTHILVCRRWHDIIVGNPLFWNRLFLTGRSTLETLKTWLERANWRIDSIRLSYGVNVRRAQELFSELHLEDIWSTVQDLGICNLWGKADYELPAQVLERLHLTSLDIDVHMVSTTFFESPCKMDTSQLESLRLIVWHNLNLPTELSGLTCHSLRTLELHGNFTNRDIFAILQKAELLNVLSLNFSEKKSDGFTWNDPPKPVKHANLKELHLTACHDSDVFVRSISCPNLTSFRLKAASRACGARSIEALASQLLTRLKRLHIEDTGFFEVAVVYILYKATALEHLVLSNNQVIGNGRADVCAALANQVWYGYNRTFIPARGPFCPQLKYLDLSYTKELECENITKIVEVRLQKPSDAKTPNIASSAQIDAQVCVVPNPIRTVNITGCSKINTEAIEWLKANVEQVII